MSSIKHRIGLGNCEPGINESIGERIPPENISWDSTKHYFDSTIITFDHT